MTVPDRASTVPGTHGQSPTVTVPPCPVPRRGTVGTVERPHNDQQTTSSRRGTVKDSDPFPRGDPADWATTTADPLAVLFDLFERSRPAWHDQAACRGSGVDFTATGRKERARAFDVCGRCPVRAECLEWAIEVGDEVAVLGGMDPAARRRMGQS